MTSGMARRSLATEAMAAATAALLLYLPSLFGGQVWDDELLLSGGGVRDGASLRACFTSPFMGAYYRPLTAASLYLDRILWGPHLSGYHAVSMCLHAITAALVVLIAWRLGGGRRMALTAGLFFAVHPVMAGAVAWIGGRTDALAGLFAAAFTLLTVGAAQEAGGPRRWRAVGACGAYALGILCKEQVIPLALLTPLAFAMLAPRSGRRPLAGWLAFAPAAALAGAYLLVAPRFGMLPPPAPLYGFATQLGLMGESVVRYARLVALPTPDALFSFSLDREHALGWTVWGAGAALAAAWIALFVATVRSERGAALCVVGVAVTLAPVLNLVPLAYLLAAPYRACLAIPFAAVLASMLLRRVLRARRTVGVALGGIACLCWVAQSLWSIWGWGDDERFFRTVVRHDPRTVVSRYMLMRRCGADGRYAEAVDHGQAILGALFETEEWRDGASAARAWHEDPRVERRTWQAQGTPLRAREYVGLIFTQLGLARGRTGDVDGARQALLAAEQFGAATGEAQTGLAWCDAQKGEMTAAAERLERLLVQQPDYAAAHAQLADIYRAMGRGDLAEREARQVAR